MNNLGEEAIKRMLERHHIDTYSKTLLSMTLQEEKINAKTFKDSNLPVMGGMVISMLTFMAIKGINNKIYIKSYATARTKQIVVFKNKNYNSKDEVLLGLEEFFKDFSLPLNLRVSVIVDNIDVVKSVKEFCQKKIKMEGVKIQIDEIAIGPDLPANSVKDLIEFLKKKKIAIKSVDEIASKGHPDMVILGGGYGIEQGKFYRDIIFDLLRKGIIISTFEQINFTLEELGDLEDVIETSSIPEGLAMDNGGNPVAKPFNWNEVQPRVKERKLPVLTRADIQTITGGFNPGICG